MTKRVTVKERFYAKVALPDARGCMLWLSTIDGNGYGQFKLNGRYVRAHRLSYELLVEPIPDSLEPDHTCRVPLCVAPDHLEPVTHRLNCLRSRGIGAINAAKTHCPSNHEYTKENTYTYRGRRDCKECIRIRARAYKHRKRRELIAA